MMKYEYHTIFVSTPRVTPKKYMGKNEYEVDGVQFSRDVQSTIHEMSEKGFDLLHTIPLASTQYYQLTHTSGVTMIFRKEL